MLHREDERRISTAAELLPLKLHSATGIHRVALTSFVGRQHEIDAIVSLLHRPEVRLLTLTGTGGIGKTRLAQRVSENIGDRYRDGVIFVSLAFIRTSDLVLAAIVRAMAIHETSGRSLMEKLQSRFREKNILLVLDNFEHLLDAGPDVAELLATCPSITIICTSRTRLGVSGEYVYIVPPLAMPKRIDSELLNTQDDADAFRLFVQRAESASSNFILNAQNAEAIAEICRRVDGLPLAIELAAARISVLSPDAILTRLEHRFDLLTDGPRDAPARLRDMRDAIAWSYDLLTEDERVLFRHLGVFSGGFTLDAAAAVDSDHSDVLAVMSALVLANLVVATIGVGGEPRFFMLETIRAYALEQLAVSGEQSAIFRLHAHHWLSQAEEMGEAC